MSLSVIRDFWVPPFENASITAASSSRRIELDKRPEFLSQLGINPDRLNLPKQVHEDAILFCDGESLIDQTSFADGLITNRSKVPLGIQTADCLPVFFWSPVDHVIGLAHAGWRGVKAGILPRMVRRFRQDYNVCACDIRVAFGPAIGNCCYEVGEEFRGFFPNHFNPKQGTDKGCMDLTAEGVDQLVFEGVQEKWIHRSGLCTVCENKRFFSYRKEKTDERILSVIQLN